MGLQEQRIILINELTDEDIQPFKDLNMIKEACGLYTVKTLLQGFPDGVGELRVPRLSKFDAALKRFIEQHKSLSDKELAVIFGVERQTITRLKKR